MTEQEFRELVLMLYSNLGSVEFAAEHGSMAQQREHNAYVHEQISRTAIAYVTGEPMPERFRGVG